MKITDRDKKLLCVVGAAIIIFCAYYFGCRILINKTQEITETISTLNKEHNALKLMLARNTLPIQNHIIVNMMRY